MRRVVTGHNASGEVEVLSDEDVPAITVAMLPGVEVHRMWELDHLPELPVAAGQGPPNGSFFPGPGGLRFGYITIPPGLSYDLPADITPEALEAAGREAEEKLPGMAATFDPDRPGMHATETVDYIVALAGEGRMEGHDGIEIRLRAGDCLIQNGAPHAWFNDGTEPFVLCYTLCGAR